MLSKIIYASRASRDLAETDLRALLEVSRRNNEASRISGLLLYAEGSFLQLLEGEEAALLATYERIRRDSRHSELRLLTQSPISRRRFADWSMGFDFADAAALGELPGYRSAAAYPLVDANLVRNASVAELLLGRYAGRAPAF
ncbi:MAG TPA: BLUF domain-containing protein [Nevskiaceae bacterium]|nr:BLUF domain-containing protein [Nevskiaceae bacterium]